MRTISHWGMFGDFDREIPATRNASMANNSLNWANSNNYANQVNALYDQKNLHGQQDYQLYFNEIPKQKF